ncbi:carbon storage regulator [Oceanicoccus sp. KOV_DT_Chl]
MTILSQNGNQARIGITAPQDVPILRDELIARNDAPASNAIKSDNGA